MKDQAENNTVEIIRDRWGVPHIFAERESDGFFGLGFACAQDRLLQMELLRRRARGRLAEVFGAEWVDSDRKFRIGGIGRHCAEALANMPLDLQDDLRAYAAGVNAYIRANPDNVRKRFAPLNVMPEPWTPSDCIAAWMAHAEMFDLFIDDRTYWTYGDVGPEEIADPVLEELRDFQRLVAEMGEEKAFKHRGRLVDDDAAVVPESEMAKNTEVYARLKAKTETPGFHIRGITPQPFRFSHAWAVDGTRSTTGKPILESDPQTPVNNPAIYYEYHLCAGRYDVRGVGAPGAPNLLIGFNRHLAWGATGLGAGCTVNFLEKLSDDEKGFLLRGEVKPFVRRLERIDVRDGEPVVQEVLTNHHGFVFNSLARCSRPGEAYVAHYRVIHEKGTSVRAMLEWMRASDWEEFVAALEHYYSPGINLVYADVHGNIGYYTLAYIPLTKRSRRWILEGWTGEDEVLGRIPLEEMPHMLNPDAHVVFSANHLPVGSWYPYDLGLAGSIGQGPRAMRLRQLLASDQKFSVEDFEAKIHRDNVNPVVAALWPVARRVTEEDGVTDELVQGVMDALQDWDLRYDSHHPAYWTAMALSDCAVRTFRRTGLKHTLSTGWSGVCRLANMLSERFAQDGSTPKDPEVRSYLVEWLRATGERMVADGRPLGRQTRPTPHTRTMPYQSSERISFPSVNPELDIVSPPVTCGQVQTIWSQIGNAFTQIVDLSNVDNSRTVLPPGVSEDPDSPFYLNQMDLWLKGATHPAPLSRDKVEALAASHQTISTLPYEGPDAPDERVVRSVPDGAHLIAAIPQASPSPLAKSSQVAQDLANEMYPR